VPAIGFWNRSNSGCETSPFVFLEASEMSAFEEVVEISKDYGYNYGCGFCCRDDRDDVQEENDFCSYRRQDEQGGDHPLLEADLLLLGEGNLAFLSCYFYFRKNTRE
jgi:hypothetical protein